MRHYVYDFRELNVYKEARKLSLNIFNISKSFPKAETYSLTDQVRRSSRSIGANIAEAWAKRTYEKHFISKLTDGDAEQQETQHWIETALDCEYISQQQANQLLGQCRSIGRMLGSMISKSSQFCRPKPIKEAGLIYYFDDSKSGVLNTDLPNTDLPITE